jgi:hypothetical protein
MLVFRADEWISAYGGMAKQELIILSLRGSQQRSNPGGVSYTDGIASLAMTGFSVWSWNYL